MISSFGSENLTFFGHPHFEEYAMFVKTIVLYLLFSIDSH
jgi:hypothetical protein